MAAKGPYNTSKTSLFIFLCCSLFINAANGTTATLTESTAYASQRPCAKSCFYWGSSSQGGPDYLAYRIGCEVDPIMNECICRSDLQQTADSFLRKCVSDKCSANAIDVSSAVGIYDDYCTSNGYTRATSTAQTTRTTSSDGAGVWGSTSAAGSPWATVETRLTVVDALGSTSQANTATSTSEKGSDQTTESTKQLVPSVTQTSTTTTTTTTSPTTSSGTGEEDKPGQGDGSQLKVGEIVGIVVGILGFIATAVGSWFSYKTLKQRKRLANPL